MSERNNNTNNSRLLDYNSSVELLLTKGVCGHSHIEGSHITSEVIEILDDVEKLYGKNRHLARQFKKLTGKSYKKVMSWVDRFEENAKKSKKLDFEKDFLTALYVMKLGEASSPEHIYRLTKAQLSHELAIHAGIALEVYPLVWIEMGLDYEECCKAFVRGVEDVLKDYQLRGPLKLGVSTKRKHLVEKLSRKENKYLAQYDRPYLKVFELAKLLKASESAEKYEVFADIMDIAAYDPLFNCKDCPERAEHSRAYFETAKNVGAKVFTHLLEELPDRNIVPKGKSLYYEMDFVMELFEDLDIERARLIHMAYWPQDLPYVEFMKERNFEISVCQTSTQKLGAAHYPRSPFLLKNPDIINGLIFDDNFVRLILSNDDSGPLGVEDAWEELLLVRERLERWYGGDRADLALVQFLRNDYEGWSAEKISKEYGLDKSAVEWVLAYDIFKKKEKLHDYKTRSKVLKRIKEVLLKRQDIISSNA